jgi:hypothetical protein
MACAALPSCRNRPSSAPHLTQIGYRGQGSVTPSQSAGRPECLFLAPTELPILTADLVSRQVAVIVAVVPVERRSRKPIGNRALCRRRYLFVFIWLSDDRRLVVFVLRGGNVLLTRAGARKAGDVGFLQQLATIYAQKIGSPCESRLFVR